MDKFTLGIMIFSFLMKAGEKNWAIFLFYCTVAVILSIFSLIVRWILLKIDKGIDIATKHARENNGLVIMLLVAIIVMFITVVCLCFKYFGQMSAYTETTYMTSTIDSRKMVLVNTYRDSYIFKGIERLSDGKYRLNHNIKIVKPDEKNQSVISLDSEELGLLNK